MLVPLRDRRPPPALALITPTPGATTVARVLEKGAIVQIGGSLSHRANGHDANC